MRFFFALQGARNKSTNLYSLSGHIFIKTVNQKSFFFVTEDNIFTTAVKSANKKDNSLVESYAVLR